MRNQRMSQDRLVLGRTSALIESEYTDLRFQNKIDWPANTKRPGCEQIRCDKAKQVAINNGFRSRPIDYKQGEVCFLALLKHASIVGFNEEPQRPHSIRKARQLSLAGSGTFMGKHELY